MERAAKAGRQGGRAAGRQGGRAAGRQGGRAPGRQGGRAAGLTCAVCLRGADFVRG
jgi:hypothetical protein